MSLQQLSDRGFQNYVAEETGVHQTTVCKTSISVMDAVLEKANIFIKFPRSAEAVGVRDIPFSKYHRYHSLYARQDSIVSRIQ